MFTPEQMQQLEQLMDRKLKRNRQSLMRSIRKEFHFTNGYFDKKLQIIKTELAD